MAKKRDTRTRRVPPAETAIQFKVTLKYIRPPIWRRVVLPDNATLADLSGAILASMGWYGGHLHAFRFGETSYMCAEACEMDGPYAESEESVLLREVVLGLGHKFVYEYDFGDGWEHAVTLEKLIPLDPSATYPLCLGGKRACPPEDCGGVPGYDRILEALAAKRKTNDQKELLEWVGPYDPEKFDLAAVHDRLAGKSE